MKIERRRRKEVVGWLVGWLVKGRKEEKKRVEVYLVLLSESLTCKSADHTNMILDERPSLLACL